MGQTLVPMQGTACVKKLGTKKTRQLSSNRKQRVAGAVTDGRKARHACASLPLLTSTVNTTARSGRTYPAPVARYPVTSHGDGKRWNA